jgi:hypothetical protein
MLFLLPIHLDRYSVYLRTFCYGNRTHVILSGPGPIGRQLQHLPWLPIMRPEHLRMMHEATHLLTLALPLSFRILHIELYRNRESREAPR